MSKEESITKNIHMPTLNTLRPRQNGCHFTDDTFKYIFLNENVKILVKTSLKFVPEGPIDNITALVQIMAWRRPGDKPLSEPMMVRLPTHICITRPQWVNFVTCDATVILVLKNYANKMAEILQTIFSHAYLDVNLNLDFYLNFS